MQPRSLQQILGELDNVYNPQVDSIRQQQALLPSQTTADIAKADAAKSTAFDDILNGARRRGAGFSGIPLDEQAKYASNVYAPQVLQVQNDARTKAFSLEDAINQIQAQKYNQGQQMYQYETTLNENRRQFDEQQAMARAQQAQQSAAAATPSFAFNPNLTGPKSQSATAVQRSDKGFNYFDANGRAISAAAYAAAKGLNFRDVLNEAAKAGDKGSQTALGFVGNDLGYDPRKVNSKQLADLYNALVWGTGKQATYNAPQAGAKAPAGFTPPTAFSGFVNPLALRR
jgi:hypothetical protein